MYKCLDCIYNLFYICFNLNGYQMENTISPFNQVLEKIWKDEQDELNRIEYLADQRSEYNEQQRFEDAEAMREYNDNFHY